MWTYPNELETSQMSKTAAPKPVFRPDDLVSSAVVAKLANTSAETVKREARQGTLPGRQLIGSNGVWVYVYGEVESWIAKRRGAKRAPRVHPGTEIAKRVGAMLEDHERWLDARARAAGGSK
jgi:hypothetical protein